MIWALLAAYFLSGAGGIGGAALTSASVKQLSEHAEAVIEDPDRSEAAQQTFKELRKEVRAFEKMFTKSGSKLTKSYRDHAADRDQAIAILDDLNSGWEAAQQRALDLRFELKDSMSEAEWTALFDGR
jgi:16S rRNA C1402 N4-methylase RsmH